MSYRKDTDDSEYMGFVRDLLDSEPVRKMGAFTQHGGTTTYTHCRAVAFYSYRACRVLHIKADYRSLSRGALLHDLFLYDWHVPDPSHRFHGFCHPRFALENARRSYTINRTEENIIRSHMWPLTITYMPHCREAWIVCMTDKVCSLIETCRRRSSVTFRRICED
jgi:uncharacterized protein